MEAIEVAPGRATVAMTVDAECLNQLGSVHGGVTFSLIDEAFELACNSHGTVALALNVNVSFVAPALPGDRLTAEPSNSAAPVAPPPTTSASPTSAANSSPSATPSPTANATRFRFSRPRRKGKKPLGKASSYSSYTSHTSHTSYGFPSS